MIKRFLLLIFLIIGHLPVWSQCMIDVTVPNDITICNSQIIDLIGTVSNGTALFTEWNGTNGFFSSNASTSNTPTTTTTYTFTAYSVTNNNLVINGDFSAGDINFTSNYLPAAGNCPGNPWGVLGCEGTYAINTNPVNTHINFASCGDHTSGTGNMIIFNGSASPVNAWCQDIIVTPNTDYLFSAWGMSVVSSSPAILQFSINGNLIGDDFNLSSSTCNWQNFTSAWNSGTSTNATICIRNLNTVVGGNDFALDDIEFLEVCKKEDSLKVTFPIVLGSIPTSNSIDCDNPTVNLSIDPAPLGYTYNWAANFGGVIDGPTNGPSILGSSAGLYQVTITDENGCTKKLNSTINGSTQSPFTTLIGDFSLTCDLNIATVFIGNPDPNYIYEWFGSSNNSTTAFAEYNQGGNFGVQITNQYNCSAFFPFTITDNILVPIYDIPIPDVLNCIGDSTTISFTASNMPSQINWYNDDGVLIGNSSDIIVNDIGFYNVEFSYPNGCTFTDSVQVFSQLSSLNYNLEDPAILNCINTNTQLEINVNSPFSSITWKNDTIIGSGNSVLVSQSGIYEVEILDNNGCLTRDSIIVEEDFDLNPYVISADDIDCIDGKGEISIISDSVITVVWTLPDASSSMMSSFESNVAGLYIATITHDNGCSEIDSVELIANQNFPVVQVEFDSITCAINTAQVIATSNFINTDYSWTGPNSFVSNSDSFSTVFPGTYFYTAITADGCSSSGSIFISEDITPPVFSLESDTITCLKDYATINLTSSDTYEISIVTTTQLIEIQTNKVLVGTEGLTKIFITAENGCTEVQDIVIVSDFTTPEPVTISDFTLNCLLTDSLLIFNTPANESGFWIDGIDTMIANNGLFITNKGNYELLIVNNKTGCVVSNYFEVIEDFEAKEIGITGNDLNCNSDMTNLNLSINQDYINVEYPPNLIKVSDTEYTVSSKGTYDFLVTYENGCTAESSISINEDFTEPFIQVSDYGFTCNKEPLILTAIVDIDFPIYSWEGPLNITSSEDFLLTAIAGTYIVTVTNPLNGCSSFQSIDVAAYVNTLILDYEINQPLCFGEIGSINNLEISGGNEPYDFKIEDSNNVFFEVNNLPGGVYNLIITDNEGCDSIETIIIDETINIDLDIVGETILTLGANGQLQANTNLQNSEISTITWKPEQYVSCTTCLETEVSGITEDTWFYLTITDQNNCLKNDSILIRVIVDYSFYIANAFSPNDDGMNDIFYIQSNTFGSNAIVNEFSIFDRWGEKIFSQSNFPPNKSEFGWDGSFKSKMASQGTYAYFVLITLPDNTEKTINGSVTIIK